VRVSVRKPAGIADLDPDSRTRNALLRPLRYQGERGFALVSPAVADPAAGNAPSRQDGRHCQSRPRPSPVRVQNDQLVAAEKTSIRVMSLSLMLISPLSMI
jgi:hypothetical protein